MADRFSRRWWAGLLASLTLVVGLVSGSLVAQTGASAADPAASVQWVKALPKDAANPSEVKSVAVASDGSIYAAGLSGDKAWLVKFGADGSLKWNKTYPYAGFGAYFSSVASTADGSAVVVGTYHGQTPGLAADWEQVSFVAKFGADGSQKWLNNYGFVSSYDVLSSVAVKADGSGVAVGKFDGKSAVVKFGANGSQAWRKTGYSDSNNGLNGRWESVALASDASIVAIGQLDGVSKVVKLGADGSQKWIKSIDSADAILAAVAVAADGSVVVTGATPSTNFVAKYGSNGSQAWLKSVTSDDSSLVSVAVAADGSIVTAGPGTQVGKRGSDGTMKWAKAYELTLRGNEYIGAVALAPGGGIVLGGSFGDAFQTGQVAKLVDPALMPRITSAAVSPAVWSGKAVCPKVSVKAGSSVVPASGYSVSGCGTNIGKYTVTVTGKAGFAGSVRVASQVVPQTVKISKAAAGKKKATVSWTKANAKQKITKYQVAYRLKGASAWKVKTTKASAKSLAVKSLKKKKTYEFRVRAYKTVAKVNYYGGWSAIKTAKVK